MENITREKKEVKMKIVINDDYGGFGLSEKAYEFLGLKWDRYGYEYGNDRSNPKLVECVEKLGEKASGALSKLRVVEIPDGIEYTIEYYDGWEHIAEKHRTWP